MCEQQAGVHLNENEFICEVLDPETGHPTEAGELVITNLGRIGMPVIRYRTGDYVKLKSGPCECGRKSRVLEGGVIGRVDDALIIRGLNVYPATIENIISSSQRSANSPFVHIAQIHSMNLKYRLSLQIHVLLTPSLL